jgi:hypothetical protein
MTLIDEETSRINNFFGATPMGGDPIQSTSNPRARKLSYFFFQFRCETSAMKRVTIPLISLSMAGRDHGAALGCKSRKHDATDVL